jgi:hypothetical protein
MSKVTQDPTRTGPPLPDAKGLRRRYGLTLAQYLELLEAQGGVCAICGRPPTQRTGALVVDHDHDPPYPICGLVHSNPCNRRLLQQVRHYLADPPGRRFGWTVPPEREARTITRREEQRQAAKERRAAKKAEREREREDRYGIGKRYADKLAQAQADQLAQERSSAGLDVDRIEDMTRPNPVSQYERLLSMTQPDPDDEAARVAEARRRQQEWIAANPPPPKPDPEPAPAKRRSRFRFRLGGSETSGG